jgi:hypothetical protein
MSGDHATLPDVANVDVLGQSLMRSMDTLIHSHGRRALIVRRPSQQGNNEDEATTSPERASGAEAPTDVAGRARHPSRRRCRLMRNHRCANPDD